VRNIVISAFFMALAVTSVHAEERKDIFIASSLGFTIEPPASAGDGTYQVAIFNLPTELDFSGSVNVQRQEFPDSIAAYDQLTMSQFKQFGMSLMKREQRKGEYVYEYTGHMQERSLHWYARAISVPPYVFLVTATALEESWPKQKTILVKSVESFTRP